MCSPINLYKQTCENGRNIKSYQKYCNTDIPTRQELHLVGLYLLYFFCIINKIHYFYFLYPDVTYFVFPLHHAYLKLEVISVLCMQPRPDMKDKIITSVLATQEILDLYWPMF